MENGGERIKEKGWSWPETSPSGKHWLQPHAPTGTKRTELNWPWPVAPNIVIVTQCTGDEGATMQMCPPATTSLKWNTRIHLYCRRASAGNPGNHLKILWPWTEDCQTRYNILFLWVTILWLDYTETQSFQWNPNTDEFISEISEQDAEEGRMSCISFLEPLYTFGIRVTLFSRCVLMLSFRLCCVTDKVKCCSFKAHCRTACMDPLPDDKQDNNELSYLKGFTEIS